MPKSKLQKQTTVDTLVSGLKNAKGVVFANFQGLTVAETEELRKIARKEGVSVLAAKKTLVERALQAIGMTDSKAASFKGGIATFIGQDETTAAKIVATFAKKNNILSIFAGIMDGKLIDAAMVQKLAILPSKQELLGKMLGSLNAPISGFVNVNAAIVRSLFNVLNAYKAKKV